MRAINGLVPYARNSRTHSPEQVDQIAASMREWGWTIPVLVDEKDMIIAGHGRILAAQKLGITNAPLMVARGWTEAQKRAYVIADNKLALNAGWDMEKLAVEIGDLSGMGFDLNLTGFNGEELAALADPLSGSSSGVATDQKGPGNGSLSERFGLPPFSVLNAREGWWQDRKRAWLALGIKSENGRDDSLTFRDGEDFAGKVMAELGTTSVFDPVLAEIAYTWFCPRGGTILDPFAGGSVRGVVASKLGKQYIGHELRPEQVAANRVEGEKLCSDPAPIWIEGDSRLIDKTCKDVEADFVFSCPPYADLEVYSDDPSDLSNMPYADFRVAYREIIAKACGRLKQDRFAAFVVGEVRDKNGAYLDFVGDTVQAFRDAGLYYYNEAILVTMCGSVSIRAGRQFSASRKLGKTHQNILIFVKGDGKKASQACGEVEIRMPEETAEEFGEEL